MADLEQAIRINPRDPTAFHGRGRVWCDTGHFERAITDYNEAVRLNPNYAQVYNDFAWIRATCPDEKYRDGRKAIELATKACEPTSRIQQVVDETRIQQVVDGLGKDPYHLGTLAAAYAEAGEFDAAVKWQTKANGLYADPADRLKGEQRLKLYQEKKPYRDTRLRP